MAQRFRIPTYPMLRGSLFIQNQVMIERVTGRKVRGPHMEDIGCKCQHLSF